MKLLTNEIIETELEKRGYSQKQLEADPSNFTRKVLNHYESRVDDRWTDQDLYVYEESTRDGYSVWICTHNPTNVCIAEEVYYNEGSSDIIEQLQDAIRNGLSIYCDDMDQIHQAVEEMIDSFYDDVQADVELELQDQGYAWPPKIPELLKDCKKILSETGPDNIAIINRIDIAIEQLNNADETRK